jgi:hypothetical protein
MPVSKETIDGCESDEDGTGDVWGRGIEPRGAADGKDKDRQQGRSHQYRAAVNGDSANPFSKIISPGLEHEPFVSEIRKRDVDEAGEKVGDDVAVSQAGLERRGESRVTDISEKRIEAAYHEITEELTGRDVRSKFREPACVLRSG